MVTKRIDASRSIYIYNSYICILYMQYALIGCVTLLLVDLIASLTCIHMPVCARDASICIHAHVFAFHGN